MLPNEITPSLTEICGIHVGDGYLRNDGKRVELDISGHMIEDRPYYDEHVIPLFNGAFGMNISAREFPARGTYGFVMRKRKIVRFFHDFLGFPYGPKTRIVTVPDPIIRSVDAEMYSRFLRGFFDTDGSLNFRKSYGGTYRNMTFKRTHHTYPRIFLTTVSPNLVIDIRKMLNFLNIRHRVEICVPTKESEARKFRIWICGEKMLEKWMEMIGFKNPVQITRYEVWKKLGFCPPGTTLDERIQMLKG